MEEESKRNQALKAAGITKKVGVSHGKALVFKMPSLFSSLTHHHHDNQLHIGGSEMQTYEL